MHFTWSLKLSILYNIILYYPILYYTILYHTMLSYLVLLHLTNHIDCNMLDRRGGFAPLSSGGLGGVGWVGMLRFLAIAHMLDATQLTGWDVKCSLHLHTCWMLRNWWGGMLTFLALAHMLDATQLMGWVVNVPCSCTHVGWYAIDGVGC